jgi:hypothetical protein
LEYVHASASLLGLPLEPMEEGASLSGVQPKVGVIKQGDHYVGRTRLQDTRIIAKLPVVGQPKLPELEDLSLRLASAAGVSVTQASLEPLEKLAVEIRQCVTAAFERWPAMIANSLLTDQQKGKLLAHFNEHRLITSLATRATRAASHG